jgi:RimJ/RimL family protein N-acetyltransferase
VIPYVFSTPLTTERLALRIMTADDVDAVHAYQSLEEVTRYELFDPRDRETVAAKIDKWKQATRIEKDGDYIQFAIVRLDSDQLIGELYFTLKSVENQNAEIGWTVNPAHQRQGFATEAARAVLAAAFDTMQLHRVCADLDPRNEASIALCLRLGMRHEAHFVEDLWFKGDWGDTDIYAILDREWRS